LRLLVYEFVSGGGYAEKPIPPSILSEGFGMLRTLVSDFRAAGHSVTTMLDSRLSVLNPPVEADSIQPVSSWKNAQAAVQKSAESADAVYVIAPESDNVLRSLLANFESKNIQSLNCLSSAVGRVSDKAVFQDHVKRLGVPTPESVVLSVHSDVKKTAETVSGRIGFPVVFKPLNEVGCTGLSVVKSKRSVAGAVKKIVQESSSKYFMAQELIHGVSASVSLISTGSEALPVSLNKQNVSLGTPGSASTYDGGIVPFDSPQKHAALSVAKRIVESFKGLRGYVGVDLVLSEDEPVVIELNPRLTTSYVGFRRVAGFNPAQAIVDAVLERKLPQNNESRGYAYFLKVKTPKPTKEVLQESCKIREVVSPPYPVSDGGEAFALLSSHGSTVQEANMGLNEAEKRLLGMIGDGGKRRW
jgi:predicted ATP-grasp superfamily ATP-dependent carboligase